MTGRVPRSPEMRAFANGLRLGKVGYDAMKLTHAPGDLSEVAKAERRGWVMGFAAHQRAVNLDDERAEGT